MENKVYNDLPHKVQISYFEPDGRKISYTFRLTAQAFESMKTISQANFNTLLEGSNTSRQGVRRIDKAQQTANQLEKLGLVIGTDEGE